MAAYLIGDVNVTDAAAFEEYRQKVPATEAKYADTILGVVGQQRSWKATGSRIV